MSSDKMEMRSRNVGVVCDLCVIFLGCDFLG